MRARSSAAADLWSPPTRRTAAFISTTAPSRNVRNSSVNGAGCSASSKQELSQDRHIEFERVLRQHGLLAVIAAFEERLSGTLVRREHRHFVAVVVIRGIGCGAQQRAADALTATLRKHDDALDMRE